MFPSQYPFQCFAPFPSLPVPLSQSPFPLPFHSPSTCSFLCTHAQPPLPLSHVSSPGPVRRSSFSFHVPVPVLVLCSLPSHVPFQSPFTFLSYVPSPSRSSPNVPSQFQFTHTRSSCPFPFSCAFLVVPATVPAIPYPLPLRFPFHCHFQLLPCCCHVSLLSYFPVPFPVPFPFPFRSHSNSVHPCHRTHPPTLAYMPIPSAMRALEPECSKRESCRPCPFKKCFGACARAARCAPGNQKYDHANLVVHCKNVFKYVENAAQWRSMGPKLGSCKP